MGVGVGVGVGVNTAIDACKDHVLSYFKFFRTIKALISLSLSLSLSLFLAHRVSLVRQH